MIQVFNEIMGICNLCRVDDLFLTDIRLSKNYVIKNRIVKKNRLLANHSDLVSQGFQLDVFNINSVNQDLSLSEIIESSCKVGNRAFSRAGWPHQRNGLSYR